PGRRYRSARPLARSARKTHGSLRMSLRDVSPGPGARSRLSRLPTLHQLFCLRAVAVAVLQHFHRARDDHAAAVGELHPEAEIDSVKLQKTPAKRAASDAHPGEFREKRPAAHHHLGPIGRDYDHFVSAVARANDEVIERRQLTDEKTI